MNSAAAEQKKSAAKSAAYVVLTGNPNCGKTTLFNALTGLRAKVGNYAGVTVERKEGKLLGAPAEAKIQVLDLPGTYSLSPNSLDEQISRDVLLHRLPELPPPDLIVVVVDASNLQRNLYYATQVVELGHPTIIALNMVDVAEANGHQIDTQKLSETLGVPVMPIVASNGTGLKELRARIIAVSQKPPEVKPQLFCQLPGLFRIEATALADLLAETFKERQLQATAEALLLLSNEKALASSTTHYPQKIQEAVAAARKRLEAQGIDWRGAPIEWRYARIAEIQQEVTSELAPPGETFSDKLDQVLTHKVWGTLIFIATMALMFQSIFTFAHYPMDALQAVVDFIGSIVAKAIPPGDLNSLIVDGVIAGVGAVVVFLPQILLLFLFIGLLEDTGYMARAAFLMDRLMSKVGLHGKSFIPMLSSFACAIPGIMATRTIENPKDRIATIMIAPFMSCSARLPVYTLMIAAFFSTQRVFGFVSVGALMILAMYFLGIAVAICVAWIAKRTILKSPPPPLVLEMPPYRVPNFLTIFQTIWSRAWLFVQRAGTVILAISIILWALATFPRTTVKSSNAPATEVSQTQNASTPEGKDEDAQVKGEQLRNSFAGRLGRFIEPVIAPLGFDWKMGIALISSFAARETLVSTLSIIYNVGSDDENESSLIEAVRNAKRADGSPAWTPLVAVSMMVFFVLALQCMSTVAIVRRETNSWRWPLFMVGYMLALAYVASLITFQGGRLLGFT